MSIVAPQNIRRRFAISPNPMYASCCNQTLDALKKTHPGLIKATSRKEVWYFFYTIFLKGPIEHIYLVV